MKRSWTEEETALLKKQAATMTSHQLAQLLNRSSDSVKHRAKKLGISLRKYGESCSWSKYSNALVEEVRAMHDDGMMPKEISKVKGLPYWAVHDFVYYKRGLGYGYETA